MLLCLLPRKQLADAQHRRSLEPLNHRDLQQLQSFKFRRLRNLNEQYLEEVSFWRRESFPRRGQALRWLLALLRISTFRFCVWNRCFASRNRALELKLELAKARPSLIYCDFFQNLIYFEFDFFKLKG